MTNAQPDLIPEGVKLRDWEDSDTLRNQVFDSVHKTLSEQFPISYGGVRLELHDLAYDNPKQFTLSDQKEALMSNRYLNHKLNGTFRLYDEKTGDMLDEHRGTVMRVPYLTNRSTWIHNGNELSTVSQSRLNSGVYARRKASGELESHFNAKRGSGSSFKVRLEPETGLFKLDIGQSSLRLYSLLHDIGVPDEQLAKSWGGDLLKTNKEAYDRRVFEKAYTRLVRKPNLQATQDEKVKAINQALQATKLDRKVVERTLPNLFNRKIASVWSKMSAAITLPPSVNQTEITGITLPESDLPHLPESDAKSITKDDVLAIAMFLNKEFDAHIPLDESMAKLTDDVRAVIDSNLPGLNPELVNMLSKEKSAYSSDHIDQAGREAATHPGNDLPSPSKAQRDAGNYTKGHVHWKGLNVTIENPKGSTRSGVTKAGKPWTTRMKHHYGYIRGSTGADGDHIDCFFGDHLNSDAVFVVNQIDPKNGRFDEVKVMLGFLNSRDAKAAYLANYQNGWKGLGSMASIAIPEFKFWLEHGETRSSYQTPRGYTIEPLRKYS